MKIDRIRFIRDDVAIWLVYAGRRRGYFDVFRETGSVFLSLPGFDANQRTFGSQEEIRRHLAMSDEVGKWLNGVRRDPPSRRASSYSPYPHKSGDSEAKSFSAEVGNIQRLFADAKVGDIILSPPIGHYDPFLVGEITKKWSKADDLEVQLLQNELVPTRKVRWLNVALARRDFPPRVSRRMQNQHAITQLDTQYYEEVLGDIYPSYVWKNQSKLDIFGDSYTGTDPLQPYESAKLVKFVAASVFAFIDGKFDDFQNLNIDDAIEVYYDETRVDEFGQSFNSPGKFSVTAAIAAFSILASTGLIIATADPKSNFDVIKSEATETVRSAMSGANKGQQQELLENYAKSMRAKPWKRVQAEIGSRSNKTLPLNLSNEVEVATHKAELSAK